MTTHMEFIRLNIPGHNPLKDFIVVRVSEKRCQVKIMKNVEFPFLFFKAMHKLYYYEIGSIKTSDDFIEFIKFII